MTIDINKLSEEKYNDILADGGIRTTDLWRQK